MESYGAILDAAFQRVLHISWQAGLLTLVILGVQRVLRGHLSPAACEALWLVLLVRLLMPWMPSTDFSLYRIPKTVITHSLPAPVIPEEAPAMTSGDGVVKAVSSVGAEHIQAQSSGGRVSWPRFAMTAWLTGAFLLMVLMFLQNRWLLGAVAKRRLLTDSEALDLLESCKARMGVNTWIAPIVTPRVQSPGLLGAIRPRLLLPAHWRETMNPGQCRHIFLHEVAHVKRADVLRGWLWSVLTALHWFNPLIWYARGQVRRVQELACDARALSVLESSERISYGQTLLEQFQHFRQFRLSYGAAGVLEGAANMKGRITMALNYRETPIRGKIIAVTILLSVSLFGLTDAQQGVDIHDTIIPGRGLQMVGVGDTKETVIEKLGPPEDKSGNRWLNYNSRLAIDFSIGEHGRVSEVRFNDPGPLPGDAASRVVYAGKTTDGVAIGDSLDKGIAASGGAAKTVKGLSGEAHALSAGCDRVLYEVQGGGKTVAYKFVDARKGILYWANEDKGIRQIVAFVMANSDESILWQTYPVTVFAFAAKAGHEPQGPHEMLELFDTKFPHNVQCRTHHFRTAQTKDRLMAFICADNPGPVVEMFKEHPTLECLSSRVLKNVDEFRTYCEMSDEERAKTGLAF